VKPVAERAAILGTGLLGTSIGLALKARGARVAGVEPNVDNISIARARGAIDEAFTVEKLEAALARRDLIVLATPPRATCELLPRVAAAAREGALVIDVAGAKRKVLEAARAAFAGAKASFVGGHPMAGAPTGGPKAARADIFAGAVFALVPLEPANVHALDRARTFAEALGARPVVLTAEAHDAACARVSHGVHLAAAAVALAASEAPDLDCARALAATGLRSTTRVASGRGELYAEVFIENQDETLAMVASVRRALGALEDALRAGDRDALAALLEKARAARTSLVGDDDATVTQPARPA
jgi:prephenate dehydrogenase